MADKMFSCWLTRNQISGVGVKCRSKTQHCDKSGTFYSGTLLRPRYLRPGHTTSRPERRVDNGVLELVPNHRTGLIDGIQQNLVVAPQHDAINRPAGGHHLGKGGGKIRLDHQMVQSRMMSSGRQKKRAANYISCVLQFR